MVDGHGAVHCHHQYGTNDSQSDDDNQPCLPSDWQDWGHQEGEGAGIIHNLLERHLEGLSRPPKYPLLFDAVISGKCWIYSIVQQHICCVWGITEDVVCHGIVLNHFQICAVAHAALQMNSSDSQSST